jgi:hypothetical protein
MGKPRELFIEELEREGVESVRIKLLSAGPIPHYNHPYAGWAAEWVGEKDAQRRAANEASQASQAEIARKAAADASRAADAAEAQAKAATEQALEARRANTRATIALIIATASAIITIIGIMAG